MWVEKSIDIGIRWRFGLKRMRLMRSVQHWCLVFSSSILLGTAFLHLSHRVVDACVGLCEDAYVEGVAAVFRSGRLGAVYSEVACLDLFQE